MKYRLASVITLNKKIPVTCSNFKIAPFELLFLYVFQAVTIASKIKGLDAEQAYVGALLHDICRTNERNEKRFHGISGYEKLIN